MRDIRILGCNPSGPNASVAVSAYNERGRRMTGYVTPEGSGWRWTVRVDASVATGTALKYLDAVEQLGDKLAAGGV